MVLFNSGELINSADKLGATPLQTAAAWGHKSAEGKLFLYQVIASWGLSRPGFFNRGPRPPLGVTERFSGGHKQRPLRNSSAVIAKRQSKQNTFIGEQGQQVLRVFGRGPQTMKGWEPMV